MTFTIDTDLAVAGVLIGIIAILLAVPPLAQMFFGKPKLNFGVDEFTGSDGKALIITIKNIIVESRFLKIIGVKREVGEVMAFFDIRDLGTNAFIVKDASGQMSCAPTRENGLLVRALPAFTVGIQIIHCDNNKSWIIDARSDNLKSINAGDYLVDVHIICGEESRRIIRNIKVGNAPHETFWT